jgi:hypothetical protein
LQPSLATYRNSMASNQVWQNKFSSGDFTRFLLKAEDKTCVSLPPLQPNRISSCVYVLLGYLIYLNRGKIFDNFFNSAGKPFNMVFAYVKNRFSIQIFPYQPRSSQNLHAIELVQKVSLWFAPIIGFESKFPGPDPYHTQA